MTGFSYTPGSFNAGYSGFSSAAPVGTAAMPVAPAGFSYDPNASLGQWGNGATSLNLQGGNMTPTGGGGSGFGWNMPTAQLGIGAVASLGNLWNSYQANKLAQEQFSYQKELSQTNLANSIKSYNTQLADRAAARGARSGASQEETQAYIAANSL